jgi:hypothetical protein
LVCGDFGHALGSTSALTVVGRLIAEEPGFQLAKVKPSHDLTQDELPHVPVQLRVSDDTGAQRATFSGTADGEGWLSLRIDLSSLGLSPGNYVVDAWSSDFWVASFRARLLPADYAAHVVISDIDLTYLDTDFQSAGAVAELLEQSANERLPLPAMPLVYRALRSATDDHDRPLTYLSGSPLFFRRVLQGRMDLDEIQNDGIALKPLSLLLTHELLSGITTGDLTDAVFGDPSGLLGSIDDQLGFKLTGLFAQQLNLPVDTRLLLLGDDSEMDAVTYALFERALSGELTLPELQDELDELSVDSFWREALERLVPAVLSRRENRASPVDGIFINQTNVPNLEQPANQWLVPGLSRLHRGAWPLALELEEAGWVAPAAVDQVRAHLLDSGATQVELDAAAEEAAALGFLRPR